MAALMHASSLTQLDYAPKGLIEIDAERLHSILPGPTLIHLQGRHERPLFVSVLLHGNEPTGLHALQTLLRKYTDQPLPRSLSVFIGNVSAARGGVRRLEGQVDYNRVWPGTSHAACRETAMMQAVVEEMARRHVFASIDVHNNTGVNPHYACVNRLDHRFFRLASMFGRMVIYFTYPKGTQTSAFARLCPAVTLECGKPGQKYGSEHAFEYLDACLHLTDIPDHPVASQDLDFYHTVVQVTVREDVSFGFQSATPDLQLNEDLDHLNFTELSAGTVLGTLKNGSSILPFIACDEAGRDVASDYFEIREDRLVLKKAVMPSMLTLDKQIIRQDCFCYLMEKKALNT
ncbi:M14 family metallopeptidase [Methylocaldum sp.]|uniref:M14 family metallopeptidase n=1 Tax=Methylocaldum sp. TaxID=1969727 RepID=UPI002D4EBA7E|nr:M14 family metallopeptidase [Methylocaldum sp.]HYE37023.1 M14 family metallopeptidase [Methylocaldum sp.]